MKLIDVLIMISKGELKEGTKIKDLRFDATWILRIKNGHGLLVDEENKCYLDVVYSINNEVELIEPECISNVGKTSEPTDNTTEKIKELDISEMEIENFQDVEFIFTDIACKLNEVIRGLNNERL